MLLLRNILFKYRNDPHTYIILYMIYLIGGSPRCGKTNVAKKLAMKTHIPWFPADYLTTVIFRYIPEVDRAARFPLNKVHKEDSSNDFLYDNYSGDQIINFYDIQAKSVWEGLKAFIQYAVSDKQDFILEGYQITPELISLLDPEVRKDVKTVFLYKKDVADIEEGIKKNTDPADWLLKKTKDDKTFGKVAKMVSMYGEKTISEATKYKMSVFDMDGDFEKKVDDVVNYLIS